MRERVCLPAACLTLLLTLVLPMRAAVLDVRLFPYASGFNQPIGFVQDPTNPQVQFVVEQGGRIRLLIAGRAQPTDFLNISGAILAGGEQGLLGLAFPANAAATGRFFVSFTDPNGNAVVARFTRTGNPLVADPASRFDLRWSGGLTYVPHPGFGNHNGGCLQFGPDGYLYISLGDGGAADDPPNNAQTPSSLLGKMLRIDVSVPDSDPNGFRIPTDNPFRTSSLPGVRPEIWDFGLRNPWRFSFDDPAHGGTGALVIGDVGQGNWEEVDYEPRGSGGRNYGWRNREGANFHIQSPAPAFLPLIDPIHQYDHSVGPCIIGGYVYRGSIPELRGRYFFADYGRSRIWSMAITPHPVTGEGTASDLVEHTPDISSFSGLLGPTSFGVDAAGELYITDYARGLILLFSGPPPPPPALRIIRH